MKTTNITKRVALLAVIGGMAASPLFAQNLVVTSNTTVSGYFSYNADGEWAG